jgi:Na+/melibiose symporter-like transporter
MGFLEKIRNQPESTRKAIVWTITIIIATALIFFWLQAGARKIKEASEKDIGKELNLPETPQLPEIPSMPSLPDLQSLENMTQSDLDALIPKL